jgi:hypothetical protein
MIDWQIIFDNNNNNVVLAMTMPYSGQGWRHSALPFESYVILISSSPMSYFGGKLPNTLQDVYYSTDFNELTDQTCNYIIMLC